MVPSHKKEIDTSARFKATFLLTLGRPKEYRTRSNTEVIEEGKDVADRPGYVWDTYSPTPIMSTYLLAWVVSKYESAKSTSARGVKFEAFYANASLMQRSADVAAKMLEHFEQKVFGIDYNLPKMDIVAVRLFESGAMENLGMMTFRHSIVLHSGYSGNENDGMASSPKSDTFEDDGVMAHELVKSFRYELNRHTKSCKII